LRHRVQWYGLLDARGEGAQGVEEEGRARRVTEQRNRDEQDLSARARPLLLLARRAEAAGEGIPRLGAVGGGSKDRQGRRLRADRRPQFIATRPTLACGNAHRSACL